MGANAPPLPYSIQRPDLAESGSHDQQKLVTATVQDEAAAAAFAYFLPYGLQLSGWLTRREAGTPEAIVQMIGPFPPDQGITLHADDRANRESRP